jgi:hypothetical protein
MLNCSTGPAGGKVDAVRGRRGQPTGRSEPFRVRPCLASQEVTGRTQAVLGSAITAHHKKAR